MFLILFLDYEVKGAKRWFQIFGFTIQPSEIVKPMFVILTAWCISKTIEGKKFYFGIIFSIFFILLSLILIQPDLGMSILISATFFCQLFIAGLSLYLVILAVLFIISLSFISYLVFDHVQNRINSFLGGLGGSDRYQIDLSLLAFKNGGFLYSTPSISHKTSSPARVKDCLPRKAIFLLPILSVIFLAPGTLVAIASINEIDDKAVCFAFVN